MATIKDIAEAAGLSPVTVSNILNGRNKEIWPGARRRAQEVRRIAHRLGYRPNAMARATRTGSFGSIALLVAHNLTYSYLPSQLLGGIEGELSKRDLHLTLARLPDEKLSDEGYVPRILREWSADGLLINYHFHIPAKMLELIRRHRLPSIWLNSKQPADCVYPDERAASAEATRWLIERGHRRIAYVDYAHRPEQAETEHFSVAERMRGYEHAMQEAGLKAWNIRGEGRLSPRGRLEHAKRMLAQRGHPTAVLAHSGTSASPVCFAAHCLGMEQSVDLDVVTFDDQHRPVGNVFAVPTMVVPNAQLGAEAVRTVLEKISNPNRPLEPVVVPYAMRLPSGAEPQKPAG